MLRRDRFVSLETETLAPAEMTNLFAEISFVLRKGITKKIPVTMIIYSFDDAL